MMILIPQILASCWNISELNCDPRSEVTVAGTPKVCIQPKVKPSTTLWAVMSTNGTATGHRVKRSTIVNRYLNPFERGSVTKSMWTCSNLLLGTWNSPIGGTVCLRTLACWHWRHSRAHFETSSLIDGQTTLEQMDCRVLSTPGWPSPCMTSKMRLRKANGM